MIFQVPLSELQHFTGAKQVDDTLVKNLRAAIANPEELMAEPLEVFLDGTTISEDSKSVGTYVVLNGANLFEALRKKNSSVKVPGLFVPMLWSPEVSYVRAIATKMSVKTAVLRAWPARFVDKMESMVVFRDHLEYDYKKIASVWD